MEAPLGTATVRTGRADWAGGVVDASRPPHPLSEHAHVRTGRVDARQWIDRTIRARKRSTRDGDRPHGACGLGRGRGRSQHPRTRLVSTPTCERVMSTHGPAIRKNADGSATRDGDRPHGACGLGEGAGGSMRSASAPAQRARPRANGLGVRVAPRPEPPWTESATRDGDHPTRVVRTGRGDGSTYLSPAPAMANPKKQTSHFIGAGLVPYASRTTPVQDRRLIRKIC